MDYLYKAVVMSVMTYGCEAWQMTQQAKAKINGANAKCMSRITGLTIAQEASSKTRTYDLLRAINKRKLEWLGHILRMPDVPSVRLVKTAVKVQYRMGMQGNMLENAPPTNSFAELEQLAQNRKKWKEVCLEQI